MSALRCPPFSNLHKIRVKVDNDMGANDGEELTPAIFKVDNDMGADDGEELTPAIFKVDNFFRAVFKP